jgi:hypothetical protein
LVALDAPDDVRTRIPSLTAHGQEGLAIWTLEERLPGAHPSRLHRDLAEDVSAFLAQLGRLPATAAARSRLEAAAETIASECRKRVGESVIRIAASALDDLNSRPACFVHGDFWTGNLLVEGNRLTGVIDWSAGGSDGLPMLDALHLQLSEIRQGTDQPLGVAVAKHFLSSDELGYDVLDACGARLGLRLTRGEQRALVVAYWLDALARELRDPDSPYDGDRAGWERDNVAPVLRVLMPVTKETS